ncbi:nucleoside triphosphate pyrophosphohydrolase [Brevibacillus dissolubilis]|uniref:nucleoside triphosphate pyrophosphohydrolase n=1 Tax=Brevibacillus dissolubilis TaxID=1844116 RepID=UPI001116CD83|nr:nucleoside triphosphate pyrophosphohydrolase [Brevibacillus dissolubilis]
MPIYNKLIRDRIPQIMDEAGKTYTIRTLSDDEYKTELQKKCQEELNEYLAAENDTDSVEELADLLELIHTLVRIHGSTPEELEAVRVKKAEKRGGFEEKLFLIEVEDDKR